MVVWFGLRTLIVKLQEWFMGHNFDNFCFISIELVCLLLEGEYFVRGHLVFDVILTSENYMFYKYTCIPSHHIK